MLEKRIERKIIFLIKTSFRATKIALKDLIFNEDFSANEKKKKSASLNMDCGAVRPDFQLEIGLLIFFFFKSKNHS